MRIRHQEQETGRPSMSGFFIIFARGSIITACHVHCVNMINYTLCEYKRDFYVQVKNKPCVEYTITMRLISWIHSRGSETGIVSPDL